MNDIRKLKDQQRDKHPGFDNYLECMTRALFSGLSAFTLGKTEIVLWKFPIRSNSSVFLGFSSVYFIQKFVQKRFPYPIKTNVLISTLVGTVAAYKVTSDRTKSCQAGWLAAEDKHTSLTADE